MQPGPVRRRPVHVPAALALLAATWGVLGVILAINSSRRLDAARGIDRVNAKLGWTVPGESSYEHVATQVGVYFFFLLLALVLLIWTGSRAWRGGQDGRIGLWVTAAVLTLEPLRLCVMAVAKGGLAEPEVFFTLVAILAAALAAVLLALPPANTYFQKRAP